MSAFDGSPAEMPIVPSPADWLSPDEATAERLLSGHGVGPDAPPEQRALARVLMSAARPATEWELAGEEAAVATFLSVTAASRPRRPARARSAPNPFARRIPVFAAGGLLAVVAALGGTAAAGALPAPLQQMAHSVFGAPAPRPMSPPPGRVHKSPSGTLPASPSPAPGHSSKPKGSTTPSAGKTKTKSTPTKTTKSPKTKKTGDGNGTGNGNGNGNGNGTGNGHGTGNGNGNGNGKPSATPTAKANGNGNGKGLGNGAGNGQGHGNGGTKAGGGNGNRHHRRTGDGNRKDACLLDSGRAWIAIASEHFLAPAVTGAHYRIAPWDPDHDHEGFPRYTPELFTL